jgi:hypothetical protein
MSMFAPIELPHDQTRVPPHEGLGGREGGDSFEALATEWMGQCGKATAFGIGEPQPFMAELSFEDAVFLNHIRDHLLLVTLNPSSEHREQYMREVLSN